MSETEDRQKQLEAIFEAWWQLADELIYQLSNRSSPDYSSLDYAGAKWRLSRTRDKFAAALKLEGEKDE